MRRHAHGTRKCTGEMKDAEACDIGELGDGDVSGEMFFDVTENAAQSRTIKLIGSNRRWVTGAVTAVFWVLLNAVSLQLDWNAQGHVEFLFLSVPHARHCYEVLAAICSSEVNEGTQHLLHHHGQGSGGRGD